MICISTYEHILLKEEIYQLCNFLTKSVLVSLRSALVVVNDSNFSHYYDWLIDLWMIILPISYHYSPSMIALFKDELKFDAYHYQINF